MDNPSTPPNASEKEKREAIVEKQNFFLETSKERDALLEETNQPSRAGQIRPLNEEIDQKRKIMEKLIEEIRNEMKEVFSIYEKIKPLVEELIAYISKYKEGDIHEAKNGVEEIMQKIIKTLGGEDKFPIVEPISKPEYLFFRNLMIGRDVTKNYSKKHLNFLNRCLGELSKILNPIEVGDFVENGTILIH